LDRRAAGQTGGAVQSWTEAKSSVRPARVEASHADAVLAHLEDLRDGAYA
jgi:hypothetical protein